MASFSAIEDIARSQKSEVRSGLWTGRVESVDDPLRANRVRVRIFQLHGDKRSTPTTALPWCETMDIGGGLPDSGSGGRLYPVGAVVWIMFNQGDEDHPIVMGGRRGLSPRRDDINPQEFLTVDGRSDNQVEATWLPRSDNELPVDVFSDSVDGDNHPTRTVWAKSFRGHTILVEDREGQEFLRITDRAGQVIEMNCPVTEEANENNAQQRGSRNSIDDNQISQDNLVDGRAFVRIKDVAGQEIVLDGKRSAEEIRLTSRSRQGGTVQQIVLSSAKGREKIEIVDKQGNTFLMDPNDPTPIQIFDYSGNRIEFDAENGQVRSVSNSELQETVGKNKIQSVSGRKQSTVGGDLRERTLGNRFLEVLNDFTTSVNGFTNQILTGAVDIQVVNTSPTGSPADLAYAVNAAIGAIKLSSQMNTEPMEFSTLLGDILINTLSGNVTAHTDLGDIEASTSSGDASLSTQSGNVEASTQSGNATLSTQSGDVEASTQSGNATLQTSAGDLTAQTQSGNATLGTLSGDTALNGNNVAIGTAASAPAVLGNILDTILGQLLDALNADARIGNLGAPVTPSPGLIAAIVAIKAIQSTLQSQTVTLQI
ncbi:MAG: phage baseplate assembly protein V [Gammaproteobacteria bacterium]|nr:phage baseplate assembly protein V [Gammaproteobacteria bacterium]